MAREFRGGLFRPVVTGGLLALVMAFACAAPASADWLDTERQLTSGDRVQQWPQLSGTRLVYSDETSARQGQGDQTRLDIRVRDLATGSDELLTPDHSATGRAAISGHLVVWTDAGADAGIWSADLATGERRRLPVPAGDDPSVSGHQVCYTYLSRIRVYDLRTHRDRTVSPAGVHAGNCDISGSIVVWQDDRSGNDDIYSKDLRSGVETRITDDPAAQSMPRVDGHLVVWQDDRNGAGDTDIYADNLLTGDELQVTGATGVQSFPDVSDGRIVWTDERLGHGNTEVYAYDVASGVETRVTHDDGWSGTPTISGNRIVYSDVSGDGQHLYQRTITPPTLSIGVQADDETGQPELVGQFTGADSVPVVAASLQVEASSDGRSWIDAGIVTTAGDGSYTVALPDVRAITWFRVRFAGTPDYAPVTSTSVPAASPVPAPVGPRR